MLVDRLSVGAGERVELDRVLLVNRGEETMIGKPLVAGAKVVATAVGEEQGDKVTVFKYKRKVRYRRKTGHRQTYTRLAVTDIVIEGEAQSHGS